MDEEQKALYKEKLLKALITQKTYGITLYGDRGGDSLLMEFRNLAGLANIPLEDLLQIVNEYLDPISHQYLAGEIVQAAFPFLNISTIEPTR